ncbi:MAG: hypothetical protein Q8K89_00795 [Actinomycetota bacterium]|nr:hypothetical protein [Actinomycetota bacterium]
MVPREPNRPAGESDSLTLPIRLFNAWRKLLGRIGDQAVRLGGRVGAPVAGPGLSLAVGLGATIVGATIAQLIHPAQQPLQGLAAGAVSVMWVVARLLMMRLSNTRETTSEPGTIRFAWAVGALPQLFAVTPELKIVAWLLGAALTFRALVLAGTAPRNALWLSAWGYGIEPAGFVLVTLTRNLTDAFKLLA